MTDWDKKPRHKVGTGGYSWLQLAKIYGGCGGFTPTFAKLSKACSLGDFVQSAINAPHPP